MRRYHEFHGRRDPATLGAEHVTAFLSSLAVEHGVAASTQNQALAALLFLYRHVLGIDLPWLDDVVRARRPQRLPTVLSRAEVARLLTLLEGTPRLVSMLLYGAGLRLLVAARLRVKDLDSASGRILVREPKGGRDRATVLPALARDELQRHLERVRRHHDRDLAQRAGWVELPGALARKLPRAGREWPWQWVFPATRIHVGRETGQRRRHHFHESAVQRAVRAAVRAAGIPKRAPGRAHDMIYTHVVNRRPMGVQSPLDRVMGGSVDPRGPAAGGESELPGVREVPLDGRDGAWSVRLTNLPGFGGLDGTVEL